MKICRYFGLGMLMAASAPGAWAVQLQGVLADWACVQPMVKNGREKTLKNDRSCSLDKNYSRAAYGLITDDLHYYKLDDAGRAWALKLLKDTSAKNSLRVVVDGDEDSGTLHVRTMSEL